MIEQGVKGFQQLPVKRKLNQVFIKMTIRARPLIATQQGPDQSPFLLLGVQLADEYSWKKFSAISTACFTFLHLHEIKLLRVIVKDEFNRTSAHIIDSLSSCDSFRA